MLTACVQDGGMCKFFIEMFKSMICQAQKDNTRDLDNADEQAEKLKRRAAQAWVNGPGFLEAV